jgi:hypothetical protein
MYKILINKFLKIYYFELKQNILKKNEKKLINLNNIFLQIKNGK